MKPGDRIADPQVLKGVDAMGRGRQKAKQMKVARRLKYSVHETDLDALQRELSGVHEDQDLDLEDDFDDSDDPYSVSEEAEEDPGTYWDEDSWVKPTDR